VGRRICFSIFLRSIFTFSVKVGSTTVLPHIPFVPSQYPLCSLHILMVYSLFPLYSDRIKSVFSLFSRYLLYFVSVRMQFPVFPFYSERICVFPLYFDKNLCVRSVFSLYFLFILYPFCFLMEFPVLLLSPWCSHGTPYIPSIFRWHLLRFLCFLYSMYPRNMWNMRNPHFPPRHELLKIRYHCLEITAIGQTIAEIFDIFFGKLTLRHAVFIKNIRHI